MNAENKVLFAARLLELIRELEELAIDYCRIITANDDGNMLEVEAEPEVPF